VAVGTAEQHKNKRQSKQTFSKTPAAFIKNTCYHSANGHNAYLNFEFAVNFCQKK
jgi:hypothetical protein